MKKTIIIFSFTALSLVILYRSGVFSSLTYFLLAGIIPGTTYAIPSTFMLLLMMSAAWALLFALLPSSLFRSSAETNKTRPKRRLPKRRYEQI